MRSSTRPATRSVSDTERAPAGTTLWVAEYGNAYMLCTTDYYLAFSNAANFTLFNYINITTNDLMRHHFEKQDPASAASKIVMSRI